MTSRLLPNQSNQQSQQKSSIRPSLIHVDKYVKINKDQFMFFLQLVPDCDIYDYEIYNEEQIIRKGRNVFQIKNNGRQYHYLLMSKKQTYFLKFYFYRIIPQTNNEIQLIDEKFLFINSTNWIKDNKSNSSSTASSSNVNNTIQLNIQRILNKHAEENNQEQEQDEHDPEQEAEEEMNDGDFSECMYQSD
jgi:hypothetical protein